MIDAGGGDDFVEITNNFSAGVANGGAGSDTLSFGAANDSITFSDAAGNLTIASKVGKTVDTLSGISNFEVYTGGAGSGSVTKLVNNMVAGAYMVVIAEAYAFAAKAGIDLQTTFEATRGGFAGGPVYENKVPKLIHRDYEPGARIAVHRKDIVNAKHFAHHMGVDTPMTDVVLRVMDWMNDNGHIDEDQIAMVKYYEDKMDVTVGEEK